MPKLKLEDARMERSAIVGSGEIIGRELCRPQVSQTDSRKRSLQFHIRTV